MGDGDVHPVRRPPRTRTARSLLDAAAWMATEDGARAVLAAGVQQRLIRAEDLAKALAGRPSLPRHALIGATLADIAGGAEHCQSWISRGWSAASASASLTGRWSGGTPSLARCLLGAGPADRGD
jgi:hypothetical protein